MHAPVHEGLLRLVVGASHHRRRRPHDLDEKWREFALAHGALRGYLLVLKLRGSGTLSVRMYDDVLYHRKVSDDSDFSSSSNGSSIGDFSDVDVDVADSGLASGGQA